MKKFLSFLTAIAITVSTTTSMISCQTKREEEINTENVHEKIKAALSEPLEFNDDWIIDYDYKPKVDLKKIVFSLTRTTTWTYLTKTISYLALQRLKTRFPNLFKIFPDFTLSTKIANEDEKKVRKNLLNNTEVKFHYNFYYNLRQLQNVDFNIWKNIWRKGSGLLKYYDLAAPGEYFLTYEENYKHEITFKQKQFISDNQLRLNYLAMILNATPAVRIFNENYRSFALRDSSTPKISNVDFKSSDFPDMNLVEKLHDNPSYYSMLKEKIESNLKWNMKNLDGENSKDVIKNILSIFDDIDLVDVVLVKSYLGENIKNDDILDYVYGSEAFPNGMLLLKIKTKLKSNGVSSTKSIDETIALNIEYK